MERGILFKTGGNKMSAPSNDYGEIADEQTKKKAAGAPGENAAGAVDGAGAV